MKEALYIAKYRPPYHIDDIVLFLKDLPHVVFKWENPLRNCYPIFFRIVFMQISV